MLSHHIISRGMLNTGKWEAKQAYFTLIFTVSTGIKPNRKQPYFLSLSLSPEGSGTEADCSSLFGYRQEWGCWEQWEEKPLLTSLIAVESGRASANSLQAKRRAQQEVVLSL